MMVDPSMFLLWWLLLGLPAIQSSNAFIQRAPTPRSRAEPFPLHENNVETQRRTTHSINNRQCSRPRFGGWHVKNQHGTSFARQVRAGRNSICRFLFSGSSSSPTERRTTSSKKRLDSISTSSPMVPLDVLQDLFSIETTHQGRKTFGLPFSCTIDPKNGTDTAARTNTTIMELRLMQLPDIMELTDMSYEEYGKHGRAPLIARQKGNSDLFTAKALLEELGDVFLRPLVVLALFSKWALCAMEEQRNKGGGSGEAGKGWIPSDHVVLVLSMTTSAMHAHSAITKERLVGWVDLSLQEVRPDVNPSFLPIPTAFKKAAVSFSSNTLQGWITNLLVAPEFRGQACSKALVGACEAIATRAWSNVSSLHLHCDANPKSGKIPQQLYLGLGYRPEMTSSETLNSWMTGNTAATTQEEEEEEESTFFSSSIHVIDGVPLLYLCKDLRDL